MRRIVIRGKERCSGEWVYSQLTPSGFPNINNLRSDTISDFIGCYDIDKRSVFVGDIVRDEFWETAVVGFRDGIYFLRYKDGRGGFPDSMDKCVVVGNIWDAPYFGFTKEDIE